MTTRRGLWRLALVLLALAAGPRTARAVSIEEAENDTAGVDRHDARWRRHVCTYQSCQPYIYDPVRGEPRRGIAPGTAFADLPDSFRCPICGKGHKGDFAAYDD